MRIGALGTSVLAGTSLAGAPPPFIPTPGPTNLYGYLNSPLNVSGTVGAISVSGQLSSYITITGTVWKN